VDCRHLDVLSYGSVEVDATVLWYFPECTITILSTSYAYLSISQNVEKSVKRCARPLRFPWTFPM
jgi:hypothetical protein